MPGPSFDPLAATTMSSEVSRAARTDAATAAEHRLEDRRAAERRAASVRRRSFRERVARLLSKR